MAYKNKINWDGINKRIIATILEHNSFSLENIVQIHLIVWKAHMLHWDVYGKYLTSLPIVCLPDHPGIEDLELILGEMCSEDISGVTDNEKRSIDKASDWLNSFDSLDLAIRESCQSREWRNAKSKNEIGKELYYILDFLSDQEIDDMIKRQSEFKL